MTGNPRDRSNLYIARALVFGAVLLLSAANCRAGLICLDLEDDAIVAECCDTSDSTTPDNSKPLVIEEGEDTSSFEDTGYSFGNGANSAIAESFDYLPIQKNPPQSWIWESNKVRANIFSFDLLRPPQV